MESSIKVVIVEDDIQFLEEIALLLELSNIEVVGKYHTGREGVKGILRKRPDVALIDLGLPDISGMEVVRGVLEKGSKTEMLVLTVYDDDEHLFSALKAGAVGYIVKSEISFPEVVDAVKEVVRGGAPMSSGIARRILKAFREEKDREKSKVLQQLTLREKEILECLSRGFSTRKTAQLLGISYETVRVHLKNIYRKLQVNSLIEALAVFKGEK